MDAEHQGFTKKAIRFVLIAFATLFGLAMLTALILPKVFDDAKTSHRMAARNDLAIMAGELAQYKVDCGRYPTTEEGLGALIRCPRSLQAHWSGPYSERAIGYDVCGNPYGYSARGKGFSLRSYGADGVVGGEGNEADIEVEGP